VLQLVSRLKLKYLRRFIFLLFLPHFCFPFGRPWGSHAKCMDGKRIRCLQIVSQHVPIYLQQFPSYSNCKCKKLPFSRTAAHIFVSPGNAPATITQYVVWMERQFNACQTLAACTYLSSKFSELYDALSQCVSPKMIFLPHFCFPWRRPWGNHTKCCMDGKRV